MTRFLLPLVPQGADAEQAYQHLRERAEAFTGAVSRERRIHEVDCRQRGLDCCLRVGERDAGNGRTVAAIVQHGRDSYTVHHVPGRSGKSLAPTVLRSSEIYSVTDFD